MDYFFLFSFYVVACNRNTSINYFGYLCSIYMARVFWCQINFVRKEKYIKLDDRKIYIYEVRWQNQSKLSKV